MLHAQSDSWKGISVEGCTGLFLQYYFSTVFPRLTLGNETWLNNLIPWWQMQMRRGRYLDPVSECDYGEDGYITITGVTEWTSDFQTQGLYLPSTQTKAHRWQRTEIHKCAKYSPIYPDVHKTPWMPQATGAVQHWLVDQMPRLGWRESRRTEVRSKWKGRSCVLIYSNINCTDCSQLPKQALTYINAPGVWCISKDMERLKTPLSLELILMFSHC